MDKTRQVKSAGFTLLEFMGVLVLASIVIFLVLRQKHAANIRADAESISRSLIFMSEKAPVVYAPSFTGLSCATLANNGAFTGTSFRVDRSSGVVVYYNAEGTSALTCAAANVFGVAGDGYQITIPVMSNDLCSELASQVNSLAWVMTINGTSVKPLRGQIDPAALGTQCTAAGTSDAQSMVISIGRSTPPL